MAPTSAPPDGPNLRPTLWVGHIALGVPDTQASKRFFIELGLRDVEPDSAVGILELRGGTHLILLPASQPVTPGAPAPFDLMVDDLAAFHAELVAGGHAPGPIERSDFHTKFSVREPGGHELTINSSHVSDLPV